MAAAFTTMSQNGQIVLPREVRKQMNLKPKAKFLIIHNKNHIILKILDEQSLREEFELLEKITKSEEQIKKGMYVSTTTDMSDEHVYELLTGKPWKSLSQNNSRKTFKKSKIRTRK